MEQKKILKILGAIFAMRSQYFTSRQQYGAAAAYDNAFDMLAYAATGNLDCLRQFGFSDEAEELIEKVGENIDFWDLENLIKES